MTPPNDNIHYNEHSSYLARVEGLPELQAAVRLHFKKFPNAGADQGYGLKTVEILKFTILVFRDSKRHVLVVLDVFELPKERGLLDAFLEKEKRIHGFSGKRRVS